MLPKPSNDSWTKFSAAFHSATHTWTTYWLPATKMSSRYTQCPPKAERQAGKEIKGGGCSHHCNGISPLHCDEQALRQVGERLGFLSNLFETANQFSQERGSLEPEGPAISMATGVKSWHWVEGCLLLLLALLSQGCHCTCLSGGTW